MQVAAAPALPVANSAGVTVETADDPVNGGTMTVLTFPEDQAAIAIKVAGDDFPRWFLTSDSADGLYIGDGTYDPYTGEGMGLWIDGAGFSNFKGGAGAVLRSDTGEIDIDAGTSVKLTAHGAGTVEAQSPFVASDTALFQNGLTTAPGFGVVLGTGALAFLESVDGYHLFDVGDNTMKHAVLTNGVLTWVAD